MRMNTDMVTWHLLSVRVSQLSLPTFSFVQICNRSENWVPARFALGALLACRIGVLRERVTSSKRPPSSTRLHHRSWRHRHPDGGGRHRPDRRRSDGRQSLSAFAYLAGANGPQVAKAAIRDRGCVGLTGALYAHPPVLGGLAAA